MSLFFNPTPTSNKLPGATSDLINQPNVTGSNIIDTNITDSSAVIGIISEESDLMQNGGKQMKKTKKSKSKSVKTSKPKSKSKTAKTSKSKSKTVKTSKPKSKSKTVKTSKPKPKSKTVKTKQITLYKRAQLERLAKKNKISLKKRDGTPKTKLQLFRSLKRKGLL